MELDVDKKMDGVMSRRAMLKGSAKLTAGAMAMGTAVLNVAPEAVVAAAVVAEFLPTAEEMDWYFTTF